ncbi:hypothetical protein ARMGADRAFT_742664 [Armillaria gallica]|uniref:Uncharacterized protein n=1 Tax=Armillaria gallica TaxID=47427 RepID=A0A2H3D1E0_ARMGA|nr:hypothetical protein ARMGADRAFT_742664 [Armillaria gallica]
MSRLRFHHLPGLLERLQDPIIRISSVAGFCFHLSSFLTLYLMDSHSLGKTERRS